MRNRTKKMAKDWGFIYTFLQSCLGRHFGWEYVLPLPWSSRYLDTYIIDTYTLVHTYLRYLL
jgi:hypothetical protein